MVSNLEFQIYNFLRNICWIWFLSQLENWEKKNLFGTNKKLVSFFNCSNWEKLVEKTSEKNWWKHEMNSFYVYNQCCYETPEFLSCPSNIYSIDIWGTFTSHSTFVILLFPKDFFSALSNICFFFRHEFLWKNFFNYASA